MAKIIETLKNISEYPNSFKRQGAFPLDSKSVFQSYGDAEKYAQDKSAAATSYVGQIISVVEDGTVQAYIIGTDGSLEEFGGKDGTDNQAPSENAHAEGYNTFAGGKGFTINAVADNGDGTGNYTLSSVTGLKVGMRYSAVLSSANYNAGKITAINGNVVTVDGYKHIELNGKVDDPENFNVYNCFLIVDRPDLGDKEVGFNAHAEGENTIASNKAAHAEGSNTKAIGKFAHAEGNGTIAGHAAHAEGNLTQATGEYAHAEGRNTKASGWRSHTEGDSTTASANNAHAEGYNTFADGWHSHAEGENTIASNKAAHAEGSNTKAIGKFAHAEGNGTIAGHAAHAEGQGNTASGWAAHAEGEGNTASGWAAHAEGYNTFASADNAHAEGTKTEATAQSAHAEGHYSKAYGEYSHAGGQGGRANKVGSFAHGKNVTADADYQATFGTYNEVNANAAFVVGNGDSSSTKSNAFEVNKDGNAFIKGNLYIGGAGSSANSAKQVATVESVTSLADRIAKLEAQLQTT